MRAPDNCLEQCAVAHEVGFDSLTFAGHHYSPRQLTPNPIPIAATVGREGRYYRFRNISIWPRCVQKPHPRILISGNSAGSAALAGRLGTTALRTVIDLAGELSRSELDLVLHDALERRLFTLEEAHRRLDQPDMALHPGAVVVRAALPSR